MSYSIIPKNLNDVETNIDQINSCKNTEMADNFDKYWVNHKYLDQLEKFTKGCDSDNVLQFFDLHTIDMFISLIQTSQLQKCYFKQYISKIDNFLTWAGNFYDSADKDTPYDNLKQFISDNLVSDDKNNSSENQQPPPKLSNSVFVKKDSGQYQNDQNKVLDEKDKVISGLFQTKKKMKQDSVTNTNNDTIQEPSISHFTDENAQDNNHQKNFFRGILKLYDNPKMKQDSILRHEGQSVPTVSLEEQIMSKYQKLNKTKKKPVKIFKTNLANPNNSIIEAPDTAIEPEDNSNPYNESSKQLNKISHCRKVIDDHGEEWQNWDLPNKRIEIIWVERTTKLKINLKFMFDPVRKIYVIETNTPKEYVSEKKNEQDIGSTTSKFQHRIKDAHIDVSRRIWFKLEDKFTGNFDQFEGELTVTSHEDELEKVTIIGKIVDKKNTVGLVFDMLACFYKDLNPAKNIDPKDGVLIGPSKYRLWLCYSKDYVYGIGALTDGPDGQFLVSGVCNDKLVKQCKYQEFTSFFESPSKYVGIIGKEKDRRINNFIGVDYKGASFYYKSKDVMDNELVKYQELKEQYWVQNDKLKKINKGTYGGLSKSIAVIGIRKDNQKNTSSVSRVGNMPSLDLDMAEGKSPVKVRCRMPSMSDIGVKKQEMSELRVNRNDTGKMISLGLRKNSSPVKKD